MNLYSADVFAEVAQKLYKVLGIETEVTAEKFENLVVEKEIQINTEAIPIIKRK